MCITDSLCSTPETNTLCQLYSNKNENKLKKGNYMLFESYLNKVVIKK